MKKVLLLSALTMPSSFALSATPKDQVDLISSAPKTALAPLPDAPADETVRPVFFRIYDFYNPSQRLSTDVLVKATDSKTGEEFGQEREIDPYWYEAIRETELGQLYQDASGVIFLQSGQYTFTGEGRFCFVAEKQIEITRDTSVVDLFVGCE